MTLCGYNFVNKSLKILVLTFSVLMGILSVQFECVASNYFLVDKAAISFSKYGVNIKIQ